MLLRELPPHLSRPAGSFVLGAVSLELGSGVSAAVCRGIGCESVIAFVLLSFFVGALTCPVVFAAARAATEEPEE